MQWFVFALDMVLFANVHVYIASPEPTPLEGLRTSTLYQISFQAGIAALGYQAFPRLMSSIRIEYHID